MRKNAKRSTILIDGIRYYAEKPENCRMCFFWKNRKVGCILGKQNCYYLAEKKPGSCAHCHYHRPDFKYRRCQFTRCPYGQKDNVFRTKPLKRDKFS